MLLLQLWNHAPMEFIPFWLPQFVVVMSTNGSVSFSSNNSTIRCKGFSHKIRYFDIQRIILFFDINGRFIS